MNFIKCVAALGMSLALVACGGGGGSAGATPGDVPTTGNPSTTVPIAADFIFQLEKSTINNSGGDSALLTVVALDVNRNTLAGVPVSISLDANGILLERSGLVTDATGTLTGKISNGADKSSRTVNASITISGITKVASVVVNGGRISVTAIPSTPLPGGQVTLNLSATDSANVVIPNVDINLSGTAGVSRSVNTGVSGINVLTFNAPSTVGSYTVVANGLNLTSTATISVISSTSTIPAAVGTVSSKSLTPSPTLIAVNTAGGTVNRSRLSAKFLTGGNAGIENMRVRFLLVAPFLGNGESISTGMGTVYTDASGTAEADYIAGTRSSPTNGVSLRACYSSVDFPVDFVPDRDCPDFVPANLTVAGAPLSISIGTDNTMTKGLGGIAYLKKFLIQVNDAAGAAIKDAVVSASVDITHYGKGINWASSYTKVAVPSIRDFHSEDNLPPSAPANAVKTLQPSSYIPLDIEKIWCINEDWNRNGFLDTNEDRNGDLVIQPRKAEIVVSYVNGNKTDVNGQLLLQISYPQNMGRWLAYTLRATTSVAGSEGDVSQSFVTDVLEADVKNGSFLTPPFGASSCSSPN